MKQILYGQRNNILNLFYLIISSMIPTSYSFNARMSVRVNNKPEKFLESIKKYSFSNCYR